MSGAKWEDFEIVSRLGLGGMAEVFLARVRGAGGFQKHVVLKRALPNFTGDEELIAMFLDEARLAANLMHPNVAAIYELGSGEDGYFYVMEFVDGIDLSDLIYGARRRGVPVPPKFALYICTQLAEALAYAHAAKDAEGNPLGIVHRDVSPHNILLGKSGAVKLTDFGVARSNEQSTKTKTGALKGKMSYMSPEQLQGFAVDGRSDLFALGVILFELFAQRQPYTMPGLVPRLQAMLDEAWRDAIPDDVVIPEAVAAVIAKCLHKDASDRYADATAALRALQKIVARNEWFTSGTELGVFIRETIETPVPTYDETRAADDPPSFSAEEQSGGAGVSSAPRTRRGASMVDDSPPGLLVSRLEPSLEDRGGGGLEGETAAHAFSDDESLFSSEASDLGNGGAVPGDESPTRAHPVGNEVPTTFSADNLNSSTTMAQQSPFTTQRTGETMAESELPTLAAGLPAALGHSHVAPASDTTAPPSQSPFPSEISSFGSAETPALSAASAQPRDERNVNVAALPTVHARPATAKTTSRGLALGATLSLLFAVALFAGYWFGWGPGASGIKDAPETPPIVANVEAVPSAMPPQAPRPDLPSPKVNADRIPKHDPAASSADTPVVPAAPSGAETAETPDEPSAPAQASAAASSAKRTKATRSSKRRRSERSAKSSRGKGRSDKSNTRRGSEGEKAKAKASLTLNSIPWAKVFIDGREIGITPLLGVRVSAGQHKLRFYAPTKKLSKKQTINLKPGEKRRIQVRF